MAPLSVLPGRVRFEAGVLVGCEEGCDLIEERMMAVEGVAEASASHRTGRILVRFDEGVVTRSEIERHLGNVVRAAAATRESGGTARPAKRKVSSRGSSGTGSLIMEMALHALIPAPLDLFLPAAATVFRR